MAFSLWQFAYDKYEEDIFKCTKMISLVNLPTVTRAFPDNFIIPTLINIQSVYIKNCPSLPFSQALLFCTMATPNIKQIHIEYFIYLSSSLGKFVNLRISFVLSF